MQFGCRRLSGPLRTDSQMRHQDSQSRHRYAELLIMRQAGVVCLFQIEPFHCFNFLCLQLQRLLIDLPPENVYEGDLIVPEHPAVEFLLILNTESSGIMQLLRLCFYSKFLLQFPQS